jgi:hypothetical protein
MDHMTRRTAVGLTAAGTAAALAAGGATAQESQGGRRRTYAGSSRSGNLEEALKDAINKALAAAPGADRQVRWTLRMVSGVNGGIAPLNVLTVEIEAIVV